MERGSDRKKQKEMKAAIEVLIVAAAWRLYLVMNFQPKWSAWSFANLREKSYYKFNAYTFILLQLQKNTPLEPLLRLQ